MSFQHCIKTELFKKFSNEININNYIDSNEKCIITKEKVFYQITNFTAGSFMKGYLKNTLTFAVTKYFDKESYGAFEYFSINWSEIANINDSEVRRFAANIIELHNRRSQQEATQKLEKINDDENLLKEKLNFIESNLNLFYETYDKNNDGLIDMLENDLSEQLKDLITENQNEIANRKPEYLENLVKISKFIKDKRKELLEMWDGIKNLELNALMLYDIEPFPISRDEYEINKLRGSYSTKVLRRLVQVTGKPIAECKIIIESGNFDYNDLLPNGGMNIELILNSYCKELHIYNSQISLAFVMIHSLLQNKLVNFLEVYNSFDELGVFDTSYQRSVRESLSGVNKNLCLLNQNLLDLIVKVEEFNNNIIYTIDELNSNSIKMLESISSIEGNIKYSNLLSSIQTYQLYQINKNNRLSKN